MQSPRGQRPMAHGPDLDFKMERRDKKEENLPLSGDQVEK